MSYFFSPSGRAGAAWSPWAGLGLLLHEGSWEAALGIVTRGQVTQTRSAITEHLNPRISPGTENSQCCFSGELLQLQDMDLFQPEVQAKCSPAGLGTSHWKGEFQCCACLKHSWILNTHWQWIFKYILKSRSPVFLIFLYLPLCVRNSPLVCDFGEWPQQQMLTLKYLWKTHL